MLYQNYSIFWILENKYISRMCSHTRWRISALQWNDFYLEWSVLLIHEHLLIITEIHYMVNSPRATKIQHWVDPLHGFQSNHRGWSKAAASESRLCCTAQSSHLINDHNINLGKFYLKMAPDDHFLIGGKVGGDFLSILHLTVFDGPCS